jgi:signal transduction histidine kinase
VTATIRFRITALATLVVLFVLIAAGMALVAVNERFLTENLDESLDQEVAALAAQVEHDELPATLTGLGDDDTIAQVVADGTPVAASANVAGRGPVAGSPADAGTTRRNVSALTEGSGEMRLVSRRVDGPDGPTVIHVAGTLDDIDESTRALSTTLLLGTPPLVLLLGAVIWLLVGRTLRPVEAIRAQVAGIGGGGLHQRVPERGTRDEIDRLANTMNDMLDRLDAAAQRQDRFVADASHELRSPLTRIRSELEVDLAHPDRADLVQTHRSVLEEAVSLQRLVEDLLQLARRDAEGAGAAREDPVDLDDIVLRLARRWRAADRVEIDTSGVGAAQVVGDADALTRAVGNLVDNAVRHAASSVALTSGERDGVAVVTVTDDGPGIPPAEQDRVFERFARVDAARSAAGGTGLGLAIAREIVEQHGGSLTVDGEHHPGARFVLTVPLA